MESYSCYGKSELLRAKYRLKPTSKLAQFLADKGNIRFQYSKREYYQYQIIDAIFSIVKKEKLYNFENPFIMVFDKDLESIMGTKYLHVKDIADQLFLQMDLCYKVREASPLSVCHVLSEGLKSRTPYTLEDAVAIVMNLLLDRNKAQRQVIVQPNYEGVYEERTVRKMIAEYSSVLISGFPLSLLPHTHKKRSDGVALPIWGSPDCSLARAQLSGLDLDVDATADVVLSDELLQLLNDYCQAQPHLNQKDFPPVKLPKGKIAPIPSALGALSWYIRTNINRLVDERSPNIVKADARLIDIFGHRVFHKSQVRILLASRISLP